VDRCEAKRDPGRTEGDDVTYAAEVTTDAPKGWWKLNDTSGTTAVDSGSGTANDGTYTNPTGLELNHLGIDDGDAGASSSVWFKGALSPGTGYITMGTLAAKLQFAAGTDFTIEAWCAFDGTLANPGEALVGEAFAGDGTVRYTLGFKDGDRFPTFGWYNGSWRNVKSATELTDGGWHHLVGTYDGAANQLELWVDKVSKGTLTPGGTQPGGTESLYIGRRWDNNGQVYFNGFIDEVALYSTKLSSTRIAAHYDAKALSTAIPARVTQEWVEAVAAGATNRARVSQEWVEAVVVGAQARARVSQVWIEAVVERDYAGWDMLVTEADPSFDF